MHSCTHALMTFTLGGLHVLMTLPRGGLPLVMTLLLPLVMTLLLLPLVMTLLLHELMSLCPSSSSCPSILLNSCPYEL